MDSVEPNLLAINVDEGFSLEVKRGKIHQRSLTGFEISNPMYDGLKSVYCRLKLVLDIINFKSTTKIKMTCGSHFT